MKLFTAVAAILFAGSAAFAADSADVKEFKDDDLWSDEVTSEGQKKANIWDQEW